MKLSANRLFLASFILDVAGGNPQPTSDLFLHEYFRSLANPPESTDYLFQESLCDPNPFEPPEDWVRLGIDIAAKERLWKIAKNNSASWLVGNFEDEGDHMLSPFSWQAAHARIQMDMMTGQIPANFIGYECHEGRGWGDRFKSALALYKVALLMGWGYLLDIVHPWAPDTQYPDHYLERVNPPLLLQLLKWCKWCIALQRHLRTNRS